MAPHSSSQFTCLPLPAISGSDKNQGHDTFTLLVPIYVVTNASQLPKELLNPSPERQLVIGFDSEGVNLSRHGALCIIQIATSDALYIVDVTVGGKELMNACKLAIESAYVTKVIHDCKRDSEALYYQFGIKLHNVVDTQIAYALVQEQEGLARPSDDCISFIGLLADQRFCGDFFPSGKVPEQEILSVVDVPSVKMGCIIGKKGATIQFIKESCNAEIFIGGNRGPSDKVFIIGPTTQVRKAEAMLRGRM